MDQAFNGLGLHLCNVSPPELLALARTTPPSEQLDDFAFRALDQKEAEVLNAVAEGRL